jgi:uncharacterized protein DUF1924
MGRAAFTAVLVGAWALTAGGAASAASPLEIQRSLEAEARQATAGFAGFSAQRGEQFFNARHGDWSCATCHTADPRQAGRHATTGKAIAPFAPAANADRFTSPAKVDKWFRRNCNDVLGRTCTAVEKGDVLTWLLSLGR